MKPLVVIAALSFARLVSAQEPGTASDVAVRTSVDRPAIFVADRVTYTVELTCKRGVDILTDDLSRDRLKLEGLEMLGSDMSRQSGRDDSTIYQFRYYVTTYRVDVPALKIGPLPVRYYVKRSGQRLEDAAPAGEVQVPGSSIAFRSLLPDDEAPIAIRDDRPAAPRPALFAMLRPVGLGLVIVSLVPAALAAAAVVRRRARRTKSPRRSARSVRHHERASLEELRSMDLTDVDGRRRAFTQMDTLVREHLRDVCGIPGPSLTPDEIPFALSTRDRRMPACPERAAHTGSSRAASRRAELVTSVLTSCEAAKYAPPQAMPTAEKCRESIEQTEQLIAKT